MVMWRHEDLGPHVQRAALIIAVPMLPQAAFVRTTLAEDKVDEHALMPEPLFNETMTDIKGDDPGEVEFEVNGFRWQSLRRGAYAMQATIEAEWLTTRHLGLFVEPLFTQALDASGADARNSFGVNGGISWKLLQDFQRAFHMQAELGGRYPLDPSVTTDPGDPALPFTLDLRSGLQRGRWTVRASVGVYLPFGASGRYGFWGLEADADGGRRYPAVVALNFVPSLVALGVPFRIGFGIPWAIGVPRTQPVIGLLVRLFVEGASEVAHAEKDRD
jgi:hypothetical protein